MHVANQNRTKNRTKTERPLGYQLPSILQPVSSEPAWFTHAFQPIRNLRTDQDCSLKLHFMDAAQGVMGYIEKLAAMDPERFVWASIPNIVQHSKRYSDRKPYSRRMVQYVLAFLREQHIISGPLERVQKVGNFVRRQKGFVVAHHDVVCFRDENCCTFVGSERAPGSYDAPTAKQNARQGNANAIPASKRKMSRDEELTAFVEAFPQRKK